MIVIVRFARIVVPRLFCASGPLDLVICYPSSEHSFERIPPEAQITIHTDWVGLMHVLLEHIVWNAEGNALHTDLDYLATHLDAKTAFVVSGTNKGVSEQIRKLVMSHFLMPFIPWPPQQPITGGHTIDRIQYSILFRPSHHEECCIKLLEEVTVKAHSKFYRETQDIIRQPEFVCRGEHFHVHTHKEGKHTGRRELTIKLPLPLGSASINLCLSTDLDSRWGGTWKGIGNSSCQTSGLRRWCAKDTSWSSFND